jgi:hypothetical protein
MIIEGPGCSSDYLYSGFIFKFKEHIFMKFGLHHKLLGEFRFDS